MKLIVGLGNPGREYASDRHNVGFMCVNQFARSHRISLDKKKANARIGQGEVDGTQIVLAKPQTFVNASGQAVSALMKKFGISNEDLILVYDDLDLPVGRIRIRKGGSSGGHKGIQSVIRETGGAEFVRVRVGIGRPARAEDSDARKRDVIDHVLTDFSVEERQAIQRAIPNVAEALQVLLQEGLVAAMNRYNPPLTDEVR
jgi:PTH1 family peptidyl-tRNA hydrolase